MDNIIADTYLLKTDNGDSLVQTVCRPFYPRPPLFGLYLSVSLPVLVTSHAAH